MLPAAYQAPAGLVLIAGGLLACFAGLRLFRVVLGIYGFLLGALVASSIVAPSNTTGMIVAAIAGGLVGSVILIVAYFMGVALIGAGLGALMANLVWTQFGVEPQALVVIILSVIGAFAALALQRYVIIAATAFVGAWTAIVGALAMAGDPTAVNAAARRDVWLLYPFNPSPSHPRWTLVAWAVLGLIGAAVQLGVTPKARKRVSS